MLPNVSEADFFLQPFEPRELSNDEATSRIMISLSKKENNFSYGQHDSAQWSGGVTKPIKKYLQIDTARNFLISFRCIMVE